LKRTERSLVFQRTKSSYFWRTW